MAEQQKHEQELTHVRQSYVAQQTSIPMEQEPPKTPPNMAIKNKTEFVGTPQPKKMTKTVAMPSGLNQATLPLPAPETTQKIGGASSSASGNVPPPKATSSKKLTDGTARNRSTSRKGSKKETEDPEAPPRNR